MLFRSRLPVPCEALEEVYESHVLLAYMQSADGRIISRRRYDVAIAAINQVEREKGQAEKEARREGR